MKNYWGLFLVCGLLIALNISQSLIDLFETLIICTTLFLAFKQKKSPFDFIPKTLIYALTLFFTAIGLSYIFGAPGFDEIKVSGLLEYRWVIVFLCSISTLTNIQWKQRPLEILLYCVSSANLINFIYYFLQNKERAGGLFRNPMFYAQNLAPLMLIVLNIFFFLHLKSLTQKKDNRLTALTFLNVIISFSLLVLTQTRGVWVGCFVAGITNLFFIPFKLARKTIATVCVVVAIILTFSTTLRDRTLMNNADNIYSKVTRFAFWKANIELFKDYPIFGAGYGINNRLFFEKLTDEEKAIVGQEKGLSTAHAHNQYIQYLAGTGLFGFFSYLFFISTLLYYSLLTIRQTEKSSFRYFLSLGLSLGLICFLVSGFTECNFSIAKNRSLFLFIAATSVALYAQSKKEKTV